MTPDERAKAVHDAVTNHPAGTGHHDEGWVDRVWSSGVAEGLIAAAIRDAVAAERERLAALFRSGRFCRLADHAQGACRCDEVEAAIRGGTE